MSNEKTIRKCLHKIQQNLKSPKDHRNEFGKYPYRTLGGILENLKPLLDQHNCIVRIYDDIVEIGTRFYIKATALIEHVDTGEVILTTAFAREQEERRGMDASQVTGSASTYARKYALSALFSIDDSEDADHLAPAYWPSEERIAKFSELLEHPVFKGRKSGAKEKWKDCTTDAKSDQVLQFMMNEITEYKERETDANS